MSEHDLLAHKVYTLSDINPTHHLTTKDTDEIIASALETVQTPDNQELPQYKELSVEELQQALKWHEEVNLHLREALHPQLEQLQHEYIAKQQDMDRLVSLVNSAQNSTQTEDK